MPENPCQLLTFRIPAARAQSPRLDRQAPKQSLADVDWHVLVGKTGDQSVAEHVEHGIQNLTLHDGRVDRYILDPAHEHPSDDAANAIRQPTALA